MNMRTKFFLTVGVFVVIFSFGYLLFRDIQEEPIQKIVSENSVSWPAPGTRPDIASAPAEQPPLSQRKPLSKNRTAGMNEAVDGERNPGLAKMPESETPDLLDLPKDVQEIKQQIYALNIEEANQIPLLDGLVRTGDKDTREFWGDDWNNIDDWKKKKNGFSLEKNTDGALIFTPDEQTAREYTFFENPLAYTYDAENKEFVSEIDYYGKTIYNVAKFMSDDVLVMMTISGSKVDLNIYYKNAPQQ